MTALRPLCAVCFRHPRAEGTNRCEECGPGRVMMPPRLRPPRRPVDRAAELLGDGDDTTTATDMENYR